MGSGVLAIRQSIGDMFDMGADLGNYGIVLLEHSQAEEALACLRRAREVFESLGLTVWVEHMDSLITAAEGTVDGKA